MDIYHYRCFYGGNSNISPPIWTVSILLNGLGQEIFQDYFPRRGQEGLRVELDPESRVTLVADTHNDAILRPGRDDKFRGQGFRVQDQGVIAHGGEGTGNISKETIAVVKNPGGFPVHYLRAPDDPGSPGEPEALMPQADAEQGDFPEHPPDERD